MARGRYDHGWNDQNVMYDNWKTTGAMIGDGKIAGGTVPPTILRQVLVRQLQLRRLPPFVGLRKAMGVSIPMGHPKWSLKIAGRHPMVVHVR